MAEATAQEKDNWRRQYTAEVLVEYFQKGFGIWPGRRTEPMTVAFTAKGGDQVRWDNWRNWSTGDLPINGDAVRLDGHEVYYSGTLDLKSLDLGDGGVLRIHQGRLTLAEPDALAAGPQGGDVHLDRSGYLILNGCASDSPIDFFVRNGRLENRGNVDARSKFRIEARGGELRLAGGGNTLSLGSGSSLRLIGHSVQAGYLRKHIGYDCFPGRCHAELYLRRAGCEHTGRTRRRCFDFHPGDCRRKTPEICRRKHCARSRFVATTLAAR